MTVSSTTNRKTYAGNDVTTSFGTSPVVFFDNSDIAIYVTDDDTGDTTLLVENTDYALTGGSGSTGTVNLTGGSSPWGALENGTTLVIVRTLPLTQETDLVNNDINDAEVQETALDKLVMIAQQLYAKVSRAFTLADSDVSGASTVIPTPEANSVIGWNSAGTALVNYIVQVGTSLADLAASTGATLIGWIHTATGAVARTVASKLYDQVSVKDFGAVGDGVADDTAAIQAALDASRNIWFPAGTYKTTAQLTVPNRKGLVLRGEYQFSKLNATFAGPILFWDDGLNTRQYVILDGLTFQASGTGLGAATGLAGDLGKAYVAFLDIRDCLFSGTLRYGVTGNLIVSEINRCSFSTDTDHSGTTFKALKLYATDSFQTMIRIKNCEFVYGNDDYVLEFNYFYNIVMDGCVIEGCTPSSGTIKLTDFHLFKFCNGWFEQAVAVAKPFIKGVDGSFAPVDGRVVLDHNYLQGSGSGAAAANTIYDASGGTGKYYIFTNNVIVGWTHITTETGPSYDLPQFALLVSNNKPFDSPAWVETGQFTGAVRLTSLAGSSYETGTSATTHTSLGGGGGGGTSGSITMSYQRIGNWVSLNIPAFTLTSGTTNDQIVSNTALPAAIRPATAQQFVTKIINNGVVSYVGSVNIKTDGVLDWRRDTVSTAFTNSSTCGASGTHNLTYFIG